MASLECQRCGIDTDLVREGAANVLVTSRLDRVTYLFCYSCMKAVVARVEKMLEKQKRRKARQAERARARRATKVKVKVEVVEQEPAPQAPRTLLLLSVNPRRES